MSNLVLRIHRLIFFLNSIGLPFFPLLLNKVFIRLLFGCQLGVNTQFGNNVVLGYGGLGTVIHDRAVIGDNVVIGTCVTIGGTTKKLGVPIIGKYSMISTGSKIIGPIKVGESCVVGANAVVIDDVPDNCVVVGVPAKIVKRNISISDYRED